MDLGEESERDLATIRLPVWGRVVAVAGVVPWRFEDDSGRAVEPVQRYLRDVTAQGKAAGSVRSYAYALQRWWRFLIAIEASWDMVTSAETRDFVLWLRQASKPIAGWRKGSAATAGTTNPTTRKRYPGDRYDVGTIRHGNAVLRSFYAFWGEQGVGPIINPVPLDRARGRRPNAHHNPLEPYRAEGKLRYNPPRPKRRRRAMPDELWNSLFSAMTCNRDRAILSLDVSTGARAAELLGICGADIDWGDQLIRVRHKGSGLLQWLPAGPDAFVWLRLYLAELGGHGANDPVWLTVRRRRRHGGPLERQPLSYDAWRAVLRRANAKLGTNWSMHDLRHTCAIRMIRDQKLSLRDIQTILGHAHLTTTQLYLEEDDYEVIQRVRQHLTEREERLANSPQQAAAGYNAADLAMLLGGAFDGR
ncbi:tyrosine-type recombinase/integrase [Actinomadura sp. 3N508]|uniref:tyrosine-type recombinase/integrase n=1 Tax=Actinomadura sp. 3N508 TaxID=3375153 RepID=UPI0037B4BB4C